MKMTSSPRHPAARAAVAICAGALALLTLAACNPLAVFAPSELGSTTRDEVADVLDRYFDAYGAFSNGTDRGRMQAVATNEWVEYLERSEAVDSRSDVELRFRGELLDTDLGHSSIKANACVWVRETTVVDGLEITALGSTHLRIVSIVLDEDHRLAVSHVTSPGADC